MEGEKDTDKDRQIKKKGKKVEGGRLANYRNVMTGVMFQLVRAWGTV